MNIMITKYILFWTQCCQEVWNNWFSKLENPEDLFINVEEALFVSMVLSQIKEKHFLNTNDFFERLNVTYKIDVKEKRSCCKVCKGGEIICESREVVHLKGTKFSVKSIDSIGTMLDGNAYVELYVDDEVYVLEKILNLDFELNI